jgi:hypothetical protein
MVVRTPFRYALIALTLLWAGSVHAAPISFTGNVASDFSGPGTQVFEMPQDQTPVHIGQASWMNSAGLVSGWNFHYIATYYDASTDTMYVGVKNWGIAGDVDGKGLIGQSDPQLTNNGGSNPANFGGDKALAVGFAPLNGVFSASNPPAPVLVAGVPFPKTNEGNGLDGFTVAKWVNTGGPPYELVSSFASPLNNTGGAAAGSQLAFDPSKQHPDFEFVIKNFKAITGINPANGFVLSAQDGSITSIVTGGDHLLEPSTQAQQQQQIPEPATYLIWAGLAAGLAWKYRRSRRSRAFRTIL